MEDFTCTPADPERPTRGDAGGRPEQEIHHTLLTDQNGDCEIQKRDLRDGGDLKDPTLHEAARVQTADKGPEVHCRNQSGQTAVFDHRRVARELADVEPRTWDWVEGFGAHSAASGWRWVRASWARDSSKRLSSLPRGVLGSTSIGSTIFGQQ